MNTLSLWLFSCFFLIVDQIYCQPLSKNTSFVISKSLQVQIHIQNGLPYIYLKDLCKAKVKHSPNNFQTVKDINSLRPQFQQSRQISLIQNTKILLDTGSQQFWLADSSCYNCSRVKPFCPHVSNSTKKIEYVKGYIEGADSYVNICGRRVKFICVKKLQHIGQIHSEGIMGLRFDSVGFNLLSSLISENSILDLQQKEEQMFNIQSKEEKSKTSLQLQQIKTLSIRFQYGLSNSSLILKLIKQIKYSQIYDSLNKQRIQVKCDDKWLFSIQKFSFWFNQIAIGVHHKVKALIDTGSTQIVMSTDMCSSFIEQMLNKFKIQCEYQPTQGIACNKIIQKLKLQISLEVANSNGSEFNSVSINEDDILEKNSNRLNILCQSIKKGNDSFVILGKPFLNKITTQYKVKQYKPVRKKINPKEDIMKMDYFIELYEINSTVSKSYNLQITLTLYIVTVLSLAWVLILFFDYIRGKRSKKIII